MGRVAKHSGGSTWTAAGAGVRPV